MMGPGDGLQLGYVYGLMEAGGDRRDAIQNQAHGEAMAWEKNTSSR